MSQWRRARRIALWLTGGVILAAAAGAAGGYVWMRTSLPATSGTLQMRGATAEIRIIRDAQAVPHIFARTRADAYFALGVVHAQDRLWQLETSRRAARGRLAEAVGESGLPTDKLVAALDLDRLAARTAARNNPATRQAIRAYVAGVNAGIDTGSGALPPEFLLTGLKPQHWTEADVNRLGGLAALGFGDWRDELMRARLSTRIGCARLRDLYASPADPGPVTYAELPASNGKRIESCGAVRFAGSASADVAALPFGRAMPASNSWAISGSRTASGKPLLANDPHGPLGAPADYYPVRLSWPGFEIVGASRPGSPAIAAGRNPFIAWGVTDMMADQTDLFVERIDPADPGRYLTPSGSQPFRLRQVEIPVKGGPALKLTLRSTRHGVVVSDIDSDAADLVHRQLRPGHVLALAGLAFPEGSPLVQAFLGMAEARDWAQFQAAARDFGLQHNFAFAARDGSIGMLSAGRLPRRRADGFLPVPGWDSRFDWDGHLPPGEWPSVVNPPAGFIANANNRLLAGTDGPLDSSAFQPGWRAARIVSTLSAPGQQTPATVAGLQTDVRSAEVAALMPVLRAAQPTSDAGRAARKLMLAWDGTMAADRPEPLIWAAWQRALAPMLLEPALGPLSAEWLKSSRPRFDRLLRDGSPWCSDCPASAAKALDEAMAGLAREQGGRMADWRWGKLHRATFRHDIFSHLPLLRRWATIRVEGGGDANSVNAAQGSPWGDDPWASTYGPRYRQIIDLAEPDKSLFMIAPGVSGNMLSPWFGHLAGPWGQGRYFQIGGDAGSVARDGIGTLVIEPRP
ncbi:penicillin acylase family protein [Sandaracinobacter sp. RS1-74]|uniref:penicillin acylase family protein n=1 Tax=Sandaracinobacteroides sayramensis TaxID=2913411 RepID=UPI001EDA1952|nr:penicillin acylase family protein [Sandaracinobacteroides sayramensis]MCG2840641.1 penicillin acylase family protein [Sandaracinobacteroides sayramensis]